MPDNRPNNSSDDDELMRSFFESMKALEKVSAELEESEEEPSPIDAHEYVDPEQQDPEVYDKMVSEIERKRAERRKSIWSDEPVIPVSKSHWIDDEPQEAAPEEIPERPARPRRTEAVIRKPAHAAAGAAGAGADELRPRRPRPQGSQHRRPDGERPVRRSAAPDGERPRRKRKPKYKKHEAEFCFFNAAICIVMVFGIGIALVVMKRSSGFIESENRNLAEFPEFSLSSYFSGEFTDGIVNYYTDTIPGREDLRTLSNRFTNLFGINTDNVKIINNNGSGQPIEKETVDEEKKATTTKATIYTGPRETSASVSDGGQTTETETQTTSELVTKKKVEIPDEGSLLNGIIISNQGTPEVRALSQFGGIFRIGERYANALNAYKQMVGPTVNVYNMCCPLASAYYTPKNMQSMLSDQHECIENIAVNLKDVVNVDVFDTLKDHMDEDIYFRTDHHWQPLGAYYAAKQFAETAQVPFADLSTYEEKKIEGFVGSMYGYSNYLEDLKKYPDTLTYYKPTNEYTTTFYDSTFSNPYTRSLFYEEFDWTQNYSVILGGDTNIAEIKTDVNNGRCLVVIKNSYGNALVPFFVGSFEKIYVVDYRYCQVGMKDFFNRVGATDVLFGMAIFGCYSDDHVKMIEDLMI